MNSTLKERLTKISALKPELSQADIARIAGVKPPSVSAWFSGETKTLKSMTAIRVADAYGVSASWLAAGQGDMLLGKGTESATPTESDEDVDHQASTLVRMFRKIKDADARDCAFAHCIQILTMNPLYLNSVHGTACAEPNEAEKTPQSSQRPAFYR